MVDALANNIVIVLADSHFLCFTGRHHSQIFYFFDGFIDQPSFDGLFLCKFREETHALYVLHGHVGFHILQVLSFFRADSLPLGCSYYFSLYGRFSYGLLRGKLFLLCRDRILSS